MTVRLLVPAYGKQTNALYTGTLAAERALIDAGQADNNLSASFEYADYLASKSMAASPLLGQASVDAAASGGVGFPDPLARALASGMTTPQAFGVRGTGYVDDGKMHDFFADVIRNKKGGFLPAGDYRLSSLLDYNEDWSGVLLQGVPGKTRIIGNVGVDMLKFGNLANVKMSGVSFVSEDASTELGYKGVLWSASRNVKDAVFEDMTISCPTSGVNAFSIYSRQNAADTGAAVDGLTFNRVGFDGCGRMGATIMNRGVDGVVDPAAAMKRVWFIDSWARNMGLVLPAGNIHGMLVSFDGYGSNCGVVRAQMDNMLGIGIENTGGYEDFYVGDVTMRNFARGSQAILHGGNSSPATQRAIYERIKMVGPLNGAIHSAFYNMGRGSRVRDCLIGGHAGNYAALFQGCDLPRVQESKFINANPTGANAVLVTSGSIDLINPEGDTSASSANNAVFRFYTAAATGSRISGRRTVIRKGTGGTTVDQTAPPGDPTNVAIGNVIEPYQDGNGNTVGGLSTIPVINSGGTTPTGAEAMMAADIIRFTGVLTFQNTVILPLGFFKRESPITFENQCNWPVQIKIGAGSAGDALYPGQTGTAMYDGVTGRVKFNGGTKPGFLGTFATIAALPSAAGAGNGATANLTSARNAGEAAAGGSGSTVTSNGTIWRIPGTASAVTE